MYSATITKSGQVTLPKELRDFLGVKPGGRVTFRKGRDEVSIMRKMSDEEFLAGLDAISKKYGSDKKKMPDAIKAVRELRDGKNEALNNYYKEKFAC